jgi:hypothetical protein
VAALLLAVGSAAASDEPVEVTRGEAGWTVKATGARLEDVLGALAAQESFAFTMQPAVERPLVDVDVRNASLDDVLRRVLHGRNYTIAYRGDRGALAVSRVEVLLPQPPQDVAQPQVAAVPPAEPAAAVPQPETDDAQTARRVAEAQRQRERQQRAQQARLQQQRVQPGEVAAASPAPQSGGDERVSSSRQLWNQVWSTRGDPRARP